MMISRIWILLIHSVTAFASPLHENAGLEIRQPPPEDYTPSSDDDENETNNHGNYITCNRGWYGTPNVHDCDSAIEQFPGFSIPDESYREFLGIIGPRPPYPVPGLDGPPIQTPIVKTSGTCTAVIIISSNVNTFRNFVVNMRRLRHAAMWLVDKCPGGVRSGGRFYHNPQTRTQYLAANGYQLPEIVVFGIHSLAQSILNNEFACSKDAKGNIKCRPKRGGGGFLSGLSKPTVHSRPKNSDVGERASCSGSCLDPSECNIDANCICASNLGSSSRADPFVWGSHACTYVSSATFAMVQAKGRGGICSRGRCLLESDGTLDIAAAGILANNNLTDNSNSIPFANTSNSEVENIFHMDEGMANASSTSNSSTSISNDDAITPTNNPAIYSNLPPPLPTTSSYEAAPILLLDSQGHILPDVGSNILNCPCNCTYVSASCCLTSTVWEDRSGQVQMAPLPTNATVVCDESTGAWLPKQVKSGVAGAVSTKTNFDQVGKVSYSPGAVVPQPLGDTGG